MNLEPARDTTVADTADQNNAKTAWTRQSRTRNEAARLIGRTTRAIERKIPNSVLKPQEGLKYSERLEILIDWEGVVEEVGTENFGARLLKRSEKSEVDTEYAEIPFAEVQSDDLSLVQPGAIFYLTIFRSTNRAGQSRRATTLYFRRLPAWTRAMLASADERAQRWKKSFGVGKDVTAIK